MVKGIVCDVLTQLASVAAQEAEQELRLVIRVDEAVRKLQGNLLTVKLTDACYEMDDVLDGWNTAMAKLAIQKQAKEDAGKASHSCSEEEGMLLHPLPFMLFPSSS
uniref:Rx N-terminal domain-containing protein n=1 Tax=Quercus lobata TaxID=97700 RepID=A0A7N2L2K0_QUELO